MSSSIEKGCDRSLLDGVFVTSCLISDLTERGCFLALGLRFNHLPLFTRIVAMELAETGQGFKMAITLVHFQLVGITDLSKQLKMLLFQTN